MKLELDGLHLSPDERRQLVKELQRLVETVVVPALLNALPRPAIPKRPDMRAVHDGRLITKHDIELRVGLDITTIYRQMKRGKFPQPIKIGKRRVAWRSTDIEKWEASRPVGIETAAPYICPHGKNTAKYGPCGFCEKGIP